MRVTLQLRRVPCHLVRADELLDPALGRLEQRDAAPMERLSPLPELDRLVDRDVAALEPADDLLELAAELLEGGLCGCSPPLTAAPRSTVAPRLPVASSISSGCPGATAADSLSAAPPARTTAYPRARVARGESAWRRAAAWSSATRRRSSRSARRGAQAGAVALEALAVADERAPDGAVEEAAGAASSPACSSARSGTTSRAAAVGVEARTSAARSQSGVSCSCPTAETTGTGRGGEGTDDGLVAEGKEILEAAAAAGDDHDVDRGVGRDAPQRRGDAAAGARALDAGLGDDDVGGREPGLDAGDDIAAGGRIGARDDADRAREARQRALALGREQALGGEHALEPLDRGEVVAEPDPLDRASPGS